MSTRRNYFGLSSADKKKFVNAVLKLKQSGKYDNYVKIHRDIMEMSPGMNMFMPHGGPAFLPWHREFIRRFESDLQSVTSDPSITLPYWNWTVDNKTSSPIWGSDFMGGTGRKGDEKVMSGSFAYDSGNWTLNVTSQDDAGTNYLARNLGKNVGAKALPKASDVTKVLAISTYDSAPWNKSSSPSFRNSLEGWVPAGKPHMHNLVHTWIGGTMSLADSPNDPVFFLNHCNIDRLWAIWQKTNNQYLPVSGGPKGHNLNDPMLPWNVTPKSVLDHQSLGYTYESYTP